MNKNNYVAAIQNAVFQTRALFEMDSNYNDFTTEGNMRIVDFPLYEWTEDLTSAFVAYFKRNNASDLQNLKRLIDLHIDEAELKMGTREFEDSGSILCGVNFHNGNDARMLAKCIETAISSEEVPETAQSAEPQHKHYTRPLSDEQRTRLFDSLTEGGYLLAETPRNHFDFVFGMDGYPQDFSPLKWKKSKALLAYFVDTLFSEYNNDFFNISESCFDNASNLRQAKNNYTKLKSNDVPQEPKEADKIREIIKSAKIPLQQAM